MPRTIHIRCLIAASFFAAFVAPAGAVEVDGAVTAFVDRINETVGPVKPGDRKSIRAACATLISQAFDIGAIAPSVTDEAWKRMNGKQRAAYTQGLAKRAASDCASHGREIAGNTVEIIGVRTGERGDRLIAVKQSKGKGRTVIWQVRNSGGVLKAIDMTVDGRSFAASARRDAKAVLKRTDGDVTALVRSVGG